VTLVMGIAIYFTIWWTILFAILPLRVRSQHESGEVTPGTDPGAPIAHHMVVKAIATTLVSGVVFGALFIYMTYY
jgi:predicted secreted protein